MVPQFPVLRAPLTTEEVKVMATALEYGVIAAGISVAIIVVVQGIGPSRTSYSTKPAAPVVKPELQFSARDGRWMDIVKDADADEGEGFRAVVVKPGYW